MCSLSLQLSQCKDDDSTNWSKLFVSMSAREEEMLKYLIRFTVCLPSFAPTHELLTKSLRSNGLYVLSMISNRSPHPEDETVLKHILEVDVINLLVILVTSFPTFKKEAMFGSNDHNILRLCALIALVQIVAGLKDVIGGDSPDASSEEEEVDEKEVLRFTKWISNYVGNSDKLPKESVARTVKAKMLRFLRCAALFFHYYTDVPLPRPAASDTEADLHSVYKTLSDYLSLPTLGCLISHPFTFDFIDRFVKRLVVFQELTL